MTEAIRTIGKYGIELTEYKGEFGLTACYEGQDGKFWQSWGRMRIGKDKYSEKDRPVKVILGDRATAIAVLETVIAELSGAKNEPAPGPLPDSDIPF